MLDGFGERMSKSKGNGVDPLDIIDRYGTDALRYGMVRLATETQDSRLPVANVCPHCGELVPVKQEHMYMRTKKLACPKCKKPFRPGGPWPADDPELPTAKQASDRFEDGPQLRQQDVERDAVPPDEPRRLHARPRWTLEELPTEDRWILSPAGDDDEGRDRGARRLPLQRGGAAASTTSPGRSSATGTSR